MRSPSAMNRVQASSGVIAPLRGMLSRVTGRARTYLAEPVDGASLALFRICFGLIMVWEAARYMWPKEGGSRVQNCYLGCGWNFPFHGFEWVRPFADPWLSLVFILFALAGLGVALGAMYRVCAVIQAITLAYIFLLDEAYYLNHFYLMCLLGFLLIWMPADRCWSVDAWRRRKAEPGAAPPATVPFWPIFLLRAQLFVVYFYGGLAKFHADWNSGTPLWGPAQRAMQWLEPVLGSGGMKTLESWISHQELAMLLAIGGTAFDLAIGFMLMCRRTRFTALVLCAMFHGFNSQAFHIGVFPLLAFTGTLIFCEPDWPRRVGCWLKRPRLARPDWGWLIPGAVALPFAGAALGWKAAKAEPVAGAAPGRIGRVLGAFIGLWLAFHFLWPLRHTLIPGDANWTEEGHRFSWRMMLRSKEGYLQFSVFDPAMFVTDAAGTVDVNWEEWTRKQPKIVHQDVDAASLAWARLPELVVIFEPLLGERIILNHRAEEYGSDAAARRRLEEAWLTAYGHRPQVRPTVPLIEAVRAVEDTAAQTTSGDEEHRREFLECLRLVRERAAAPPQSAMEREQRSIDLYNSVADLVKDPHYGALLRAELARVHPFELQGAWHEGLPFLAIEDAQLQALNGHGRWNLDRARWKHTEIVLVDLARMRYDGWRSLPRILVYFQEGQPRMEWNYHVELINRQVDQMRQQPYMAHQYAQRIARWWQEEWGRRPQVFAPTSFVSFNHRPPKPIIDPAVDLSAVPIKIFSGHNDWILPLEYDPEEAVVAGADSGDEGDEASLERPRYAPVHLPTPSDTATWYANGQKRSAMESTWKDGVLVSTTTAWTEEGRILMRAEYVNGHQHGAATRWHRNGRLATEVHYRFGRRHGPAAIWYENGAKSWEGTFQNGRRHGLATGWYGDGRIAEQAEFQEGTLVRYLMGGVADRLASEPQPAAGSAMR
jgi:vitamin K-dependent gamma-carboxylase